MSTPIQWEELISARARGPLEYAPESLEEVALRMGLPMGQLIKLDANENPYGPTKRTLDMLTGYSNYHRYPDATSRRLREAIGQYIGVDPACVLVGNGSDELINLILTVFRPGPEGDGIGQVISCPPTFGMYPFYAHANDLELLTFPRDAEFRLPVADIETLCQTDPRPRILFCTSPNNPDGGWLPQADLLRLLQLPLLVILDEAYVEFSDEPSRVSAVAERGNLVVLRTFSKWAGLAGLRVGYGVFPAWMMNALGKLKSPYNVNCAAHAAALATLEDAAEARAVIAKIVAERQRLLEKLREIAFLKVRDSQANYLLCQVQGIPVATLREVMERRGIVLRYYGGSLSDYIRISVGTPMQDEALMIALRGLARQGGEHGQQ
jgi:histidinol-phosphate aminotransferase